MTSTSKKDGGRRIQAVEITLNIIDILQNEGQLGVTEIAKNLDHSKSTIHSHLRTLEDRKLIVREDAGYRLSLQILNTAKSIQNQVGNYDVIKKQVDELAEETGEIVQFGIEEHGEVSYLYKAMGEQSVETASKVGLRQPMYSTALGKAILTYSSEGRTQEIIQSTEFEAKTDETITSSAALYEELERIEDNGYAIDNEENINGLRCIAAPVRENEVVLGAISITGPSSRVTDERLHEELADAVQRAANVIELNTKFS